MNEVCFNLNGRPMWRGWRIEAPDVRRLINQEGPVTRAVSLNNGARRRAGRAAQLSAGHRRRLERGRGQRGAGPLPLPLPLSGAVLLIITAQDG